MADDTDSMPYSFNPDALPIHNYTYINYNKKPPCCQYIKMSEDSIYKQYSGLKIFRKTFGIIKRDFFSTVCIKKSIDLIHKIDYNKTTIKIQ